MPRRRLGLAAEAKPVERIAGEREQVRQIADRRKRRPPEQLDRHGALVFHEIELDWLSGARQVRHAQDGVIAVLAQVHQHVAVAGTDETQRAAAEGL